MPTAGYCVMVPEGFSDCARIEQKQQDMEKVLPMSPDTFVTYLPDRSSQAGLPARKNQYGWMALEGLGKHFGTFYAEAKAILGPSTSPDSSRHRSPSSVQ